MDVSPLPADHAGAAVAPPTAAPSPSPWPSRWLNRFAQLPSAFYTRLPAEPLPAPRWVAVSGQASKWLGLSRDWWQAPEALQAFSGGAPWPGMAPLASVYSGHQFGVWAGQLGDGRALLLGEAETPHGSVELQLKGSGHTPYSRRGDGRAVLRSSIREFLCSEAMHGLGIPTTRALCLTASDLPVLRETVETAAVVTRLAPSFVRFGHFEHFAHSEPSMDALRALADHVIDAHLPSCRSEPQPYLALLRTVVARTAELLADWQAVGFCHGVMNTDNMSILGLTIDYGPFGFLDAFNPAHVCNHSDHHGRYAYARQPGVAYWNLGALAQALLPLIDDEEAVAEALEAYRPAFGTAILQRFRAKLGLRTEEEEDARLCEDFLGLLAADRVDYTIAWRRLAAFRMNGTGPGTGNAAGAQGAVRDLFLHRESFDAWAQRYAARLLKEQSDDSARALAMNRVNPKYVLRNHLAENAIQTAAQGDYNEVQRLLALLERPFDEQPEMERYAGFPPDWAAELEVSCSS